MTTALGAFEQLLLFTLVELGDDAHGVTIRELAEKETGRARSVGSIHTAMERLERRGFVVSRLGDPTPVRGGRRKRFYEITRAGARALRSSYDELQRIAAGRLGRLSRLAE